MKTLTHTIIVFVASILLAAGFAPAQNVTDAGEAEIAAVAAQMQMVAKQRQAEVAMVLAQVQASEPAAPAAPVVLSTPPASPISFPGAATNNRINIIDAALSFGSRAGSTGTVLVIPSEQTRIEDLLTINEDMSVMSRIFEKNIEQARIKTVRGGMIVPAYDPFLTLLGGGRGGIQSIYLQGFGALFLMKIDFPLTPPPDMQDDEKKTIKAEEGDPVWRQMRREMYEPEKVDRRRRTDRPEKKYDAEKVENLKTILIKALKHAANIRSLKPDESVVLTVTGSGEAISTKIIAARLTRENQILVQQKDADGQTITKMVTGTSLDNIGLSSPAILVIRAKKSDIDEFAKGDLDFEKFRQRVQLLTYPLLGGAAERRGSYDIYYNNIIGSRSTGSRDRRR